VLNLLDNAIKFGPRGQTVRLIVERASACARIVVEDEGPGIPASDRERVWSPYVRLRRESSVANEGSGIGLAVVRELAELHQGEAYAEDSPNGGARIVVEVPIAGAASSESSAPSPSRRDRVREKAREPQGWVGRARRQLSRGGDSSAKHS